MRTHLEFRGIGWRATVLRQRARLSQAEAAKLANITLKTWQNMEAGNRCQDGTCFAVA
jgi:DNA-binding XRE family transcriptional regulator